MPEHGPDADARAEAALEALREGRPVPRATGGRPAPTEVLDRLLATPPRTLAIGGAALVGAVLVAALGWVALRPMGTSGPDGDDGLFAGPATTVSSGAAVVQESTTTTAPPGIVVHAAGAVRSPGVYLLPGGSRVADLLDRAGGPTPDTDLDRVNLAAPLADGQRLYVPRRGEDAPPVVGPDGGDPVEGPGAEAAGPVDLNTATAEQLDTLPGIGPATAAAIVEHRERNGPFTSVDALLDVRGIGPAKLDALRGSVTVG